MSYAFAYGFYFLAACASPLWQRWLAVNRQGDTRSQIAFAFRTQLVITVLSLLTPVLYPIDSVDLNSSVSLLSIGCGLFGGMATLCIYLGYKHVDAGVAYMLANVSTPVAIVLSSVVLHERLTQIQFVGALLLFSSMFIVSKKHQIGRYSFDRYFWLTLLGGVSLGLFLVIYRELQRVVGFSLAFMVSFWGQLLVLGMATKISKSTPSHDNRITCISGVLQFLQHLSWGVLTYIVGNLSVVSAVTTFKAVLMFGLGAIVLHERDHLVRKLIASFVAVGGLICMR